MNSSKKKKFLLLLLALLLIYVVWLTFHILRFQTYKASAEAVSPLEIEGVYHIHSTFSDGRKPPKEIVKIAAHSSLDFIILTDHGNPNFESLASEGWKQGVLVLAGSEISVNRGHLVALGFDYPQAPFSETAETAASQTRDLNGFTIIAHPYSKTRWSWGRFSDYSGIEIINADTMLKRNILPSLPYLPFVWIRPQIFLLNILDRPEKNLRKWDSLNNIHSVYGYFSTDAHVLYRPLLSFFRLHLLLKNSLSPDFQTARHQVYDALKRGNFYNAVNSAAQAKGFRFWGIKAEQKIEMGSTSALDSPVTLHIQSFFPFASETHLIHNGKKVFQTSDGIFSYEARQPGFYRVEVYLRERSPLGKNIPWIISNPIFLVEKEK